jgi:hypothetical protein
MQCGAQYGDILYYHDNTIKYKALYITIIQYGPFLYWEYKGGKSHIANIGILEGLIRFKLVIRFKIIKSRHCLL